MTATTGFSRPTASLATALTLALTAPNAGADQALLIRAARIFDGYTVHTHAAVRIEQGRIAKLDSAEAVPADGAKILDLGDATLLPGLIELHAHLTYRHVPADTVLSHGITTVRDVGGPLHPPYGGDGHLRLMTSGPIITAPAGYPIPSLGEADIAIPVGDEQQARATVRELIAGGAVVIKVALEPGGETGAPWSNHHAHGHAHQHDKTHSAAAKSWPMLTPNIVKAIVTEAHALNRKVTAHLAEPRGAQIALEAGVDEWAHTPCEELPEAQLRRAVAQGVKMVSTIDTLAQCAGVAKNASRFAALGGEFLYGAEIAHPDIPWGIDAQELLYLRHLAGMDALEVLRTATSKAGLHVNQALLGSLMPGAPADLIAVRGDPTENLKLLEYPDLVISGGKLVVDRFSDAH
ncbi:amidohydrolase family protein [Methylococcaceae bacterium WWC4]|nr:amidohydrolase family protein [Methylococcaceae bacterium WWC4]